MDHRPPRERFDRHDGAARDDLPTEVVRAIAGGGPPPGAGTSGPEPSRSDLPGPQARHPQDADAPDHADADGDLAQRPPADGSAGDAGATSTPTVERRRLRGRAAVSADDAGAARPLRRPSADGARASGRRPQGTADRNLPLAVGVGVALAAAAIVLISLGPAYGVAFVAFVVTMCAAELFGALRRARFAPATLLGLVAVPALVLAAYWKGEVALPLVLVLTTVFTLLWYLVGVSRTDPTLNAGLTLVTVTYVGLFGSFAALMLRLPDGTGILLGTAVAVVANDVGALFAGRRFGRSTIAPDISPNKTVEGALGGALASIVVSFVVLDLIGLEPWDAKGGSALALGLLVAVLAPVGDLVESMVKRDLDVKDMGAILPGHGGLIDRFDAVLFVLPAAYYLVRLLEIA